MTQLIRNIKAVFDCIRQAGLKLTIEKCHFGFTKVEFLGRTITSQGVMPEDHKIKKFLANVRYPKSKKQVQRYIGFVNYYRTYTPRLSEKLRRFYDLKIDNKYKRITTRLIRPKMIDPNEFSLGPEDILEIDISPKLPNSAGYQHIMTMIDVFSRYLFAYQVQNMSAHTVGRCIIGVMIRHDYLPTRIISDKGSQFRAEVKQEITKV